MLQILFFLPVFLHRRQQWNILFLLSGTLCLIHLPPKNFTRVTYVRKLSRPQLVSCQVTLNKTLQVLFHGIRFVVCSKLYCQGLHVRQTSKNLLCVADSKNWVPVDLLQQESCHNSLFYKVQITVHICGNRTWRTFSIKKTRKNKKQNSWRWF